MRRYSEEFKAKIVAQILPPHNRAIPELVKETGIPQDTLYIWRSKVARMQRSGIRGGRCHNHSRIPLHSIQTTLALYRSLIEQIIEQEKPAYVTYEIEIAPN